MRIVAPIVAAALLAAGCGPATAGEGSAGTAAPPDTPVTSPPVNPGSEPPTGLRATRVEPRPGPGPLTPVSPQRLKVGLSDGRAYADVYWWSGVEPCYTLRPVRIERTGSTIRLHLFEGSSGGDVACIELAMFKTTRVDLGPLDPGGYVVEAGNRRAKLVVGNGAGDGSAITVTPKTGPDRLVRMAPERLRVLSVDGRPAAELRWYGGLPSCYPLRPVEVKRTGDRIRLELFEGSALSDIPCIDIAVLKSTIVPLGDLPAGIYTVVAGEHRARLVIA